MKKQEEQKILPGGVAVVAAATFISSSRSILRDADESLEPVRLAWHAACSMANSNGSCVLVVPVLWCGLALVLAVPSFHVFSNFQFSWVSVD